MGKKMYLGKALRDSGRKWWGGQVIKGMFWGSVFWGLFLWAALAGIDKWIEVGI